MIAFDSGALVARQLLIDHQGEMFIHAVNLLEIHYNFRRERDAAYADDIVAQIRDLDIEFLRDTSFLKVNSQNVAGRYLRRGSGAAIGLRVRFDRPSRTRRR